MQPIEIYVAEVPFDERKGSKFRPALVIKVDRNNVFVFNSSY